MSLFVIWMLQAGAATPAPAPPPAVESSELVGCVPGTRLFARLDVPGFTTEERHAQIMKQALGPRGIFVGVMQNEQANLELVIEKEPEEQPPMTDAEWRDFNLLDAGSSWKSFDSAGLLGGEAFLMFEGSGQHDLHGFAVRGGYRIDLHVGESWDAKRPPRISRARFVEIASTFRLALVRVGTWKEMPPRALELMDQALQKDATWRAYLEDLAKATPDDYAIHFAAAEVGRFLGEPGAKQAEDFRRAIERLAAKKDLDAADRLAHVACEHGLAQIALEAKDPKAVGVHFDAAQKASEDLSPGVRAAVLYDRACAEGRLGRPESALERLKEAESIRPGALQLAIHEKDLAAVRELPWFKNFLDGDRSNR